MRAGFDMREAGGGGFEGGRGGGLDGGRWVGGRRLG